MQAVYWLLILVIIIIVFYLLKDNFNEGFCNMSYAPYYPFYTLSDNYLTYNAFNNPDRYDIPLASYDLRDYYNRNYIYDPMTRNWYLSPYRRY